MWRTECPDHPDIARAMREGDPEAAPVYCPVCGAEFETVYEDADGNIVGCDECLRAMDPEEYTERHGDNW